MVEMDMFECKKKRLVKDTSPNKHLQESLYKKAIRKKEAAETLPDKFHEIKVTLLYDTIRILLEVVASKHSLKIYNHECYTAFLKEILKESNLGDKFDEFRRIRNSINYYDKELEKEESRAIVTKMKETIKEINKKFFPDTK